MRNKRVNKNIPSFKKQEEPFIKEEILDTELTETKVMTRKRKEKKNNNFKKMMVQDVRVDIENVFTTKEGLAYLKEQSLMYLLDPNDIKNEPNTNCKIIDPLSIKNQPGTSKSSLIVSPSPTKRYSKRQPPKCPIQKRERWVTGSTLNNKSSRGRKRKKKKFADFVCNEADLRKNDDCSDQDDESPQVQKDSDSDFESRLVGKRGEPSKRKRSCRRKTKRVKYDKFDNTDSEHENLVSEREDSVSANGILHSEEDSEVDATYSGSDFDDFVARLPIKLEPSTTIYVEVSEVLCFYCNEIMPRAGLSDHVIDNHISEAWPDTELPAVCCGQVFGTLLHYRKHICYDHKKFMQCISSFIKKVGKRGAKNKINTNLSVAKNLRKFFYEFPLTIGNYRETGDIGKRTAGDMMDEVVARGKIICKFCQSSCDRDIHKSDAKQLTLHLLTKCCLLRELLWTDVSAQNLKCLAEEHCSFSADSKADLINHLTFEHNQLGPRISSKLYEMQEACILKQFKNNSNAEAFEDDTMMKSLNEIRLLIASQTECESFGSQDEILVGGVSVLLKNEVFHEKIEDSSDITQKPDSYILDLDEEANDVLPKILNPIDVLRDHDYVSKIYLPQSKKIFHKLKTRLKTCHFCPVSTVNSSMIQYQTHLSTSHLESIFHPIPCVGPYICPWKCKTVEGQLDKKSYVTHLVVVHRVFCTTLMQYLDRIKRGRQEDGLSRDVLERLNSHIDFLEVEGQISREEQVDLKHNVDVIKANPVKKSSIFTTATVPIKKGVDLVKEEYDYELEIKLEQTCDIDRTEMAKNSFFEGIVRACINDAVDTSTRKLLCPICKTIISRSKRQSCSVPQEMELHFAEHHFKNIYFKYRNKLFWMTNWRCRIEMGDQDMDCGEGFGVDDYVDHLIKEHGELRTWAKERLTEVKKKTAVKDFKIGGPLSKFDLQEIRELPVYLNNNCILREHLEKKNDHILRNHFSSLQVFNGHETRCTICFTEDGDGDKIPIMSIRHLFEEHFATFEHLWYRVGRFSEHGDNKLTNIYSCSNQHRKRLLYKDRKNMVAHLAVAHDQFRLKMAAQFFVFLLRIKMEMNFNGDSHTQPWEMIQINIYKTIFKIYPDLRRYLDPGFNSDISSIFKNDQCSICQVSLAGHKRLNVLLKHLLKHNVVLNMFEDIPDDGPFSCKCSPNMEKLGFVDRRLFLDHLVTAHHELTPRFQRYLQKSSSNIQAKVDGKDCMSDLKLSDLLGLHNLIMRTHMGLVYLKQEAHIRGRRLRNIGVLRKQGGSPSEEAVQDFSEVLEHIEEEEEDWDFIEDAFMVEEDDSDR